MCQRRDATDSELSVGLYNDMKRRLSTRISLKFYDSLLPHGYTTDPRAHVKNVTYQKDEKCSDAGGALIIFQQGRVEQM